jgi:hypothetical protein
VLAVTYYVFSQRLYPTPYEPRRVAITFVSAAVFAGLGLLPL